MYKRTTSSGAPLRYQQQDSPQTLAEGLAEYYAANAGRVTPPQDLPPDSAILFRRHDTCHVIFGLSTDLADETMADARTMMSCDVGFRRYSAYLASDSQAKAVFRQTGWLAIAWTTVRTLPRVLRGALEATRMKKRWPWDTPESYADRTLSELRREYGIRVI